MSNTGGKETLYVVSSVVVVQPLKKDFIILLINNVKAHFSHNLGRTFRRGMYSIFGLKNELKFFYRYIQLAVNIPTIATIFYIW